MVDAAIINGGRLGYFDTRQPARAGTTRAPVGYAINAYGIALDRDQNVWQGGWTSGNAYRYTPDRPRGFRAPGGPFAPIMTILCCLLLMAGLPIMNWIRFFVWLAIGLVIYMLYSRRHSEFASLK